MLIIQLIFFFLRYYFIFKFVLHKVKQLLIFFNRASINLLITSLHALNVIIVFDLTLLGHVLIYVAC